jgi:hypothetical protein
LEQGADASRSDKSQSARGFGKIIAVVSEQDVEKQAILEKMREYLRPAAAKRCDLRSLDGDPQSKNVQDRRTWRPAIC